MNDLDFSATGPADAPVAIPGARHVDLPAAAHLANLEQPDRVDALLTGHLA